jgi:uncharacterized protein (DUF2267 family)
MKDREFFTRVADRSGLTWRESSDITRATLLALADEVSGPEARELAAHLPDRLAEPLRSGDETAKQYGPDEFAYRVRRHAGLSSRDTASGVTAVLVTLRDAAPEAADQAIAELQGRFRPA